MKKLLIALLCIASFGACGGKQPPSVPDIVATSDKDLRAAQMKVLGILQSAGGVLNEASKLEDQLAKSTPPAIPANVDRQLKASMSKTAQDALTVIDALEHNTLKTWTEVKTKVQPIIDEITALQALVTPGGHPRLLALIDALAQIAVSVLAPQLAAFGR